jgi:pyruvate/2-oxoglutarate dehydrogenase complex dihydrolipoamide dehydrogenase (E3) component
MKRTETTSSAQVLKKTQPEEFDLVILGSGTGSTIAAWTFAGEGKQVAVVERKYIGGSCPNIACLPSKNIIHSAKVTHPTLVEELIPLFSSLPSAPKSADANADRRQEQQSRHLVRAASPAPSS